MKGRAIVLACVLATGIATVRAVPGPAPGDAAFNAFWQARTADAAVKTIPAIVQSGVAFDTAFERLRAGRPYSANVAKGTVKASYRAHGRELFYALNIPASYDPARRYFVRVQLHGGVMRPGNGPRGDGTIGALAGAEQIYIVPYAWQDAPWWSDAQIENLRAILDTVKRTYNVDENHVAVSGVSDGATGAFYVAMRDTTPFASFLPLNGHLMVLRGEDVRAGDLFPNNLRNKPFFVVNGGKDRLYPTESVGPLIDELKANGLDVVYRPQPDAGHNTAWWPDVKDSFEAFVREHPRDPLPERLTWESAGAPLDRRAHWLVIDALSSAPDTLLPLDDLNRVGRFKRMLFANGQPSGRVDVVRTGNTVSVAARRVSEFTLLLSPDAFDLSKPVRVEANGRVVFDGRVEPSLTTLLTWAARDNDRTMLFAAELRIRM